MHYCPPQSNFRGGRVPRVPAGFTPLLLDPSCVRPPEFQPDLRHWVGLSKYEESSNHWCAVLTRSSAARVLSNVLHFKLSKAAGSMVIRKQLTYILLMTFKRRLFVTTYEWQVINVMSYAASKAVYPNRCCIGVVYGDSLNVSDITT